MTIRASQIDKATIDAIQRLMKTEPKISLMLQNLNKYGDLIVLGGAVRDFTYNKSPRDIDIIVDSKTSYFDDAFKGLCYNKNRFGGYKLSINNIEFDIWGIKDNWAFKEKIYEAHTENISKGTFYNFDAIAFNISTSHLYADYFLKSINDKLLDITLEEEYANLNPTPEINIVRAILIRKYWGLRFSKRVNKYIRHWLKAFDKPYEVLQKAEVKHYGCRRLTDHDYSFINVD